MPYNTDVEMMQHIHDSLNATWKTTAIICKNGHDVKHITSRLQVPYTVLDGETVHFSTGLIVTTIQYAKGLEFDHVIVPFVDAARYNTQFACKRYHFVRDFLINHLQ